MKILLTFNYLLLEQYTTTLVEIEVGLKDNKGFLHNCFNKYGITGNYVPYYQVKSKMLKLYYKI